MPGWLRVLMTSLLQSQKEEASPAVVQEKHRNLLIAQEGYRELPYKDSRDFLTVGIGRNLETVGIRYNEAIFMLNEDLSIIRAQLSVNLPVFEQLDEVRKGVLVNITYNIGFHGFLRFNAMIAALEKHDYAAASKAMLDSLWAKQVGQRAVRLAEIMRTGSF